VGFPGCLLPRGLRKKNHHVCHPFPRDLPNKSEAKKVFPIRESNPGRLGASGRSNENEVS
jgi:hypothetical protein